MALKTMLCLSSGAKIPVIGLGTWMSSDETQFIQVLNKSLEIGYRHIDTATAYENEHVIGKVLKEWISSGKLKREDVFVTTKLPPWGMTPGAVGTFLQQSLKSLQLDYLDMYLIHVPFGFKPQEGKPFGNKEDGTIDFDKNTNHIEIWKSMEQQVDKGLTKSIGLSNFNKTQVERILKNCRISPSNLQIEHHVYLQQKDLIEFCKKNDIVVTAYSPLGSPGLTQLGREVPDILSNPTVIQIATKHKKSSAQVLIRNIIQKGLVVIPKSTNLERLQQNFNVFDFELSSEDMKSLSDLDRGLRILDFEFLFKGIKEHPEYPFTEN